MLNCVMQDTKAKVTLLPEAALFNDGVISESKTEDCAVSIDAGDAVEVSVEAVTPSLPVDSQPTPIDTGDETASDKTADMSDGLPAADTEGLLSTCSAFRSTSSSADPVYTDGNAEERCHVVDTLYDDADIIISVGDVVSYTVAVSASEVTTSDVATAAAACDAEFVSSASVMSSENDHPTNVTHDISSQLNLGNILAESFISSTQSVASVISTQATIGSPLIAVETSTSSDLRTSAPGICLILLCMHFSLGL